MGQPHLTTIFPVRDYDLAATLNSGQVFRWAKRGNRWVGVVGRRWVNLETVPHGIAAWTAEPMSDWQWLAHYLQTGVKLDAVLATFPEDEPMRAAVNACRGLRLLRQDPWECLVSFILSSTKQIVQIRQIIASLCEKSGERVPVPAGEPVAHAFPSPARLAACSERELRECKAGFRAAYLRAAALAVAEGRLDLDSVHALPLEAARNELMQLPGVGPKIADCVLLFAYGCHTAFPIDVWVMRALRQLYFPGRRVTMPAMRRFAESHFGPHAGYAQQYLFHSVRQAARKPTGI